MISAGPDSGVILVSVILPNALIAAGILPRATPTRFNSRVNANRAVRNQARAFSSLHPTMQAISEYDMFSYKRSANTIR